MHALLYTPTASLEAECNHKDLRASRTSRARIIRARRARGPPAADERTLRGNGVARQSTIEVLVWLVEIN